MSQHLLEVLASCLRLPENLYIVQLSPTVRNLEVQMACRDLAAACPLCHQLSERVHSSYGRTVADVPCGGRRVVLSLTVRKFVCGVAACLRKIFTERLPELVQPYARMTNRLQATLQSIGLAAGGETGTRLAAKLGIHTTPPTLLCHLMQLPQPPKPHVRVLGIDDWSWKKRHRYGTLLIDLERRKIIDILPDRKASTVVGWLREHPEIEFLSRDRGTEYAAAAREGAPQAIQIVDRFHLVKNLAEVLQVILARCRKEIRPVLESESPQENNELFLWGMPVSDDDHLHIRQMTFHRLFARSDDLFETKWLASRVLSRVGFAHWELSDGPAQKIEAHLPLILLKSMGDFRFAGLEFQSHRA